MLDRLTKQLNVGRVANALNVTRDTDRSKVNIAYATEQVTDWLNIS